MPNNLGIGVDFTGDVSGLKTAAAQGASALNGFANAASKAFDEVAAGDAAMKRISASIDKNVVEAFGAAYRAAGQLEDSFQRIPPSVAQAGRGFGQIGKDATTAAQGLRSVPPAAGPANAAMAATIANANKASTALKGLAPGANAAGFALTNVGRVAQDLPFGFIGIQNNLNPLLESFQRLKAETGSGAAALKALGSSLIGPAGIGLALSIVSSAFVIIQNGIAGFNKKSKEAADKAKELVDSLKSVAQVTDESGAGVQGQVIEIQALAKAVTDTNRSYEDRKRALDALKDANKAYFGDLTLESASLAKVTALTEEYTKALIAQAVVKGFKDEISRVSVELAKQQGVLNETANRVNTLRATLEKTKQSETSLTGEDRISQKYIDAKNAVTEANDEFIKQNTTVTAVKKNFDQLAAGLTDAVDQTNKFASLTSDSTKGHKKETDALKLRISALQDLGRTEAQNVELGQLEIQLINRDAVKLGFKKEEIKQLIDAKLAELFPPTESVRVKASLKLELDKQASPSSIADAVLPDATIPEGAFDKVIKKLQDGGRKASAVLSESIRQDFINTTAESIGQGILGAADLLGQTIGDIFSGGSIGEVLANAASGLLNIIGGIIQEVGKQIAIIGGLMEVLKKALGNIFTAPAASIGIGLALVALGGLLKSVKIPGFADGGVVPNGGIFDVGERGRERIFLPQGAQVVPNHQLSARNGQLEVVGRIRGRDIYLANAAEAQTRRRT